MITYSKEKLNIIVNTLAKDDKVWESAYLYITRIIKFNENGSVLDLKNTYLDNQQKKYKFFFSLLKCEKYFGMIGIKST